MSTLIRILGGRILHRQLSVQPQLKTIYWCSTKVRDEFDVKTFGELCVRTSGTCDINVKPLNPQSYPDQNVAFVDYVKSHLALKLYYDKTCCRLSVEDSSESGEQDRVDTSCDIHVPIKFDVDVSTKEHRNVSIESLDNDTIMVETETGSCTLSKILTGSAAVFSQGGDIISKGVLQGNASLETKEKGSISVSKPLSQYLTVTTVEGDIRVKSLYADESVFTTKSGNIHIGSAHRSVTVNIATEGDLYIDSLDGSLNASLVTGNVNLYVSRHEGIDITVEKGDIFLKLPDTLMTRLDLRASEISVDEQLNSSELNWNNKDSVAYVTGIIQGGGDGSEMKGLPLIKAHTTTGCIRLTQQDWFSTVRLKTAFTSDLT